MTHGILSFQVVVHARDWVLSTSVDMYVERGLDGCGSVSECCLLVPEAVVDLMDSLFSEVGPVDGLGIVVGNPGNLRGLGNGTSLLVNESHEFSSLSVGHLNVLSHHW